MTSLPKITSNQINAKSSTGPKTKQGKAVVSKNAISHGASAKQFINPLERAAYEQLTKSLSTAYVSNNPLVEMQIDRIAKIKIQLDRIQTFIDKTFAISNTPENIDDALIKLTGITKSELRKANIIIKNQESITEVFDSEQIIAASEVTHQNTKAFESHEDFLHNTPQFCHFLFRLSKDKTSDVSTVIRNLSHSINEIKTESEVAVSLRKLVGINDDSKKLQINL